MTVFASAGTFPYTVGDVAAAGGVAPSAVRFYEQHGIVTAQRTSGGQRRFDDSAACRIKVARVAQRVGLSIREIAVVFQALPRDPAPEDWYDVSRVLVEEAELRMAALRAAVGGITTGTRLCDL